MNIHFEDKELFENLKLATIAKVLVGSNMYGTNTEKSDIDYLYIYATSNNELNSFIKTHHQLQYKENGIDYNFVSLHNFLNNCINGDSTINFEVIQSKSLIGTDLEFLYDYRKSFLTYTIIRSYLGFARRDSKHYYLAKNDYDRTKRLRHIVRGYLYSKDMIEGTFDFDRCNKELVEININVENTKQLKDYTNRVSKERELLTEKFNSKTLGLSKNMDVIKGIELTNLFINYCNSEKFKNKSSLLKDFDLSIFINSFENWVEYN